MSETKKKLIEIILNTSEENRQKLIEISLLPTIPPIPKDDQHCQDSCHKQ